VKLPRRPRRLSAIGETESQRFFLTLCTAGRRPVLATEEFHRRLASFLDESPKRYGVYPGRYVIMPDHLHLFVARGDGAATLSAWVKALKAVAGQRAFQWQAGFFDHLLRSDESYERKWEYVYQNPVRAGLVATPEEWPFAGGV
jgi:REP element-mobilizing transposase RayT